jgi:hypothetical protein
MASHMEDIRRIYQVPAKRGIWVRLNVPGAHHGMAGRITSACQGSLRVRWDVEGKTGKRSVVNPLDLDYRVDYDWKRSPQSRERIALKEMELAQEWWEMQYEDES